MLLPAPFTSQRRYDEAIRRAIWDGVRLPDSVRVGPRYRIVRDDADGPLTAAEMAAATRIVRDRRSAAAAYDALVEAEAAMEPVVRAKRAAPSSEASEASEPAVSEASEASEASEEASEASEEASEPAVGEASEEASEPVVSEACGGGATLCRYPGCPAPAVPGRRLCDAHRRREAEYQARSRERRRRTNGTNARPAAATE